MNDPFAYLSVMISIVLGLALAHVLGSVVRIINNRGRTVMYWPSLLWAGTLLLLVAQLWWADASLRTHTAWSFVAFLVLLAQPAALYLLCALIIPVPRRRKRLRYARSLRTEPPVVPGRALGVNRAQLRQGFRPVRARPAKWELWSVAGFCDLRDGRAAHSVRAGAEDQRRCCRSHDSCLHRHLFFRAPRLGKTLRTPGAQIAPGASAALALIARTRLASVVRADLIFDDARGDVKNVVGGTTPEVEQGNLISRVDLLPSRRALA